MDIQLKQESSQEEGKQKNQITGQLHEHQEQFSDPDTEGVAINALKMNPNAKTYKSFFGLLGRILNLCLSSFYFGYTVAYLGSYDFQSMVKLYKITQNKQLYQGLLQSIVSIGAAFGAMGAGLFLKWFSRRNCILVINLLALVFGLLILFPNLTLFIIGRFFQGVCVGLYSAIIPVLIKEFSPNELSGVFGACNQTLIAFGVFFAFAFQLILLQINEQLQHWRVQHGLTLITIVIQSILLLIVYKQQTPKYYLLNNQQQMCNKLVRKIYKEQYVKFILVLKKADLGLQSTSKKQDKELPEIEIGPSEKSKKGKKLRIFIAVNLAILQQFVGINAVVSYGVQIVSKVLPNLGKIIPVILNFQALVFGLISTFILGKIGRVPLIQCGTMVASISLVFVAIGFQINNDTGLFLFMGNFGMTLGPLFWLYAAEIVQPEIIPFTTLTNWLSSTFVIMLFPVLSSAFKTPVPLFFFFALWSFVFFFINNRLLVETKDKTEKQIRDQYSQK